MKLQTKIVLGILPVVVASIFILGYWAAQRMIAATTHSTYRYLNKVVDSYLTDHVSGLHSILVQNGLDTIESFVKEYQQKAIMKAEKIANTESAFLFALNETGDLVFHQDTLEADTIVRLFGPKSRSFVNGSDSDLEGHLDDSMHQSGFVYSVRYFKPWKWIIFFAVSDVEIHAAQRDIRYATIGMAGICASILLLLIIFVFQKFFVGPIKIIRRAALSITAGSHFNKIEIYSRDELGDLARSMEEMSAKIQKHKKEQLNWQQKLEQKVEERTRLLHETNDKLVAEASERQKVEESLKHFRLIMDQAGEAIFITDLNTGRFIDVNTTACKCLGYSREELLQLSLSDTVLKYQSSKELSNHLEEMKKRGESIFIEEGVHRRKDGSTYPFEVSVSTKTINNQTFLLATSRDITERKQAESVLQESEERFRTIFEQAPLGIALNDSLTGNIYVVNPRFAEIAGRTREEMTTIDWMSITHPDDVQENLDNMALLNAGKISGFNMNKRYIHPDGSEIWINMTIAPVVVEDKTRPRHLCMIEDITERKRIEVALKESNQSMEELVYVASHDLQSPLVSMEGFSSKLIEDYQDKLDEDGIHRLKRLKVNAQKMHKLVISLLDLSRLSTVKFSHELFVPEQAINDILKGDLTLLIEQAKATIKVEKMPEMFGDKQRLVAVFRRLILNAVKYKGTNITTGFNNGAFFVNDDGIGIPENQLQKIFAPGERLKRIDVEGTGMGLTFCRNVINRHEGKIWAESKGENMGSTFYFTVGK